MAGYSDVYLGKGWDKNTVQATEPLWENELKETCSGSEFEQRLRAQSTQPESFIRVDSVDFILVTANYWNGPIKDFVLTVKTPYPATRVKFCWDGPVTQPDATHIIATAHDFSPKRDLHVDIFEVF